MKNTNKLIMAGFAAFAIAATSMAGFAASPAKATRLAETSVPKIAEDRYYGGRGGCGGGYGMMNGYGAKGYTEEEWTKIREERHEQMEKNLAAKVKEGILTQAEADKILKEMKERQAYCEENGYGMMGRNAQGTSFRGGMMGRGMMGRGMMGRGIVNG